MLVQKMINQNNFAGEILRATVDAMKEDQKSIIMGLGVTDPKALIGAGLASVLPPVIRWLNPSDSSLGIKK
jgi:hypothetical protein